MNKNDIRKAQIAINEKLKEKAIHTPVHLAIGHETAAIAVSETMGPTDYLVLTHRNIAYNLARGMTLKEVLALYKTSFGSMTLRNPKKGVVYTSMILGNNFPVACGLAMAQKRRGKGKTIVLGGDGSIEEGTFYESLLLAASFSLPIMFVIENNGWSLATKIHERRAEIDLTKLADAFSIPYLCSKNPGAKLKKMKLPCIVEIPVSTGGGYTKENREINYHSGIARI